MKKAALLCMSLWSSVALAQPASNELLLSLYDQLQALQQEVQNLRGMVENQSNQIRRLETESRDRYMDLDRRLADLANNPGAVQQPVAMAPATPASPLVNVNDDSVAPLGAEPVVQAAIARPAVTSTSPVANSNASTQARQLSEQDLYRTALNMLLDEGNSSGSVEYFQVFIERFPQSRLMPNALYWQGEAYILLAQHQQAINVFDRVLKEFPLDPKAAGSMLKSGVALNLMGERARAEQTWNELLTRYPESTSELTLAREYLNQRR